MGGIVILNVLKNVLSNLRSTQSSNKSKEPTTNNKQDVSVRNISGQCEDDRNTDDDDVQDHNLLSRFSTYIALQLQSAEDMKVTRTSSFSNTALPIETYLEKIDDVTMRALPIFNASEGHDSFSQFVIDKQKRALHSEICEIFSNLCKNFLKQEENFHHNIISISDLYTLMEQELKEDSYFAILNTYQYVVSYSYWESCMKGAGGHESSFTDVRTNLPPPPVPKLFSY